MAIMIDNIQYLRTGAMVSLETIFALVATATVYTVKAMNIYQIKKALKSVC